MSELSKERQAYSEEWTERIRQKFINGLARPALWLAEKVGEHYEPPFDYVEDDADDHTD